MYKILKGFAAAAFVMVLVLALSSRADAQGAGASQIPVAAVMQPSQLVALLRSSPGDKPMILQVGSHVLYEEAHIPGSIYAGAAGDASGIQDLRGRVQNMSRTQFVVLYCGCCPWSRCPNIEPAYALMHSLGFSHLKVLYLANNFGADWVDKGYPTVRGK